MIRYARLTAALTCAALAIAAPTLAEDAEPAEEAKPAAEKPKPCASAEHRQFDFWVGTWTVTDRTTGEIAGENRIESILEGCALGESWQSAKSPFRGNSYNTYDSIRGVWHQTWVDIAGNLLLLDGGLDADGQMVLEQTRKKQGSESMVTHRITWTPMESGQVRQHWVMSEDGGETWKALFDGLYTRKE